MSIKLRSNCPISRALEIIGDRWTLLIVRDMHIFGKKRFEEFLASDEKISTNILTDRLKKLEELSVIERNQYGAHSQRMEYSLTEKGRNLAPVLRAISDWSRENAA